MALPSCAICTVTAAVRRDARRTTTLMSTVSKRAAERNWHVKLAGSRPGGASAAAARNATAATYPPIGPQISQSPLIVAR
jgi:hypothetical protein